MFNIVNIEVENANKISENTYIALSQIEIGQNIFRINKSNIRKSIKTESYVESVDIRREYPGTIILSITEREPKYMIEVNGRYLYIDINGYALEVSDEKLNIPILKGVSTNLETLNLGQRLEEDDLSKFNDLIKMLDGIKNNKIEVELTSIDISSNKNYILEFASEGKTAILGDTSNLSTKMLWIKYFIEKNKEEQGIIHLNTEEIEDIYLEPKQG